MHLLCCELHPPFWCGVVNLHALPDVLSCSWADGHHACAVAYLVCAQPSVLGPFKSKPGSPQHLLDAEESVATAQKSNVLMVAVGVRGALCEHNR